MLKKPIKRLPRKFNRQTSSQTRDLVQRRHARKKRHVRERWQRRARKWQRTAEESIRAVRRWLPVIACILVAFFMSIFLFSPLVRVRDIRVQRLDSRLEFEKVQRALGPLFGKHLLFISTHEVEDLVLHAVPDAESVHVKKTYPSKITVSVTQSPLVARLQLDPAAQAAPTATGAVSATPGLKAPSLNAYLTKNGLFIRTPFSASGETLPTVRVTDLAVEPESGTRLVSQELLESMQKAEQILTQEFGAQIRARALYVRGREFHLQTQRLTLWFDMTSSLEDQFQRYRLFLQSPGKAEATQYVDLRLPGSIVYR